MTDGEGAGDETSEPGEARNHWDFEPPEPTHTFHGDIPTGVAEDRPTTGASPETPGASATTPPDAASAPFEPRATAQPGKPLASIPSKIGSRSALVVLSIAAVVAVAIIVAVATRGDDDGDVVVGDPTPSATTSQPTTAPTPTPVPTRTPTRTATPIALPARTVLSPGTTTWGAESTEIWTLDGDELRSEIEVSNPTGDTIAGIYVIVVPATSADVRFEPAPDEAVGDEAVAIHALSLAALAEPVTLRWTSTVTLGAGETSEDALARLSTEREATAQRFFAGGPDVTVTAPRDGATAVRQVTLKGTVDADATLTVDGKSVTPNSGGDWSTRVRRAKPGEREILVVGTDRFGRTTEVQWSIEFVAPTPTPTPAPAPVPPPPPPPPTSPPEPVCPVTNPRCRN